MVAPFVEARADACRRRAVGAARRGSGALSLESASGILGRRAAAAARRTLARARAGRSRSSPTSRTPSAIGTREVPYAVVAGDRARQASIRPAPAPAAARSGDDHDLAERLGGGRARRQGRRPRARSATTCGTTPAAMASRDATFTVGGILPMTGLGADPTLTPDFPGISRSHDRRRLGSAVPGRPEAHHAARRGVLERVQGRAEGVRVLRDRRSSLGLAVRPHDVAAHADRRPAGRRPRRCAATLAAQRALTARRTPGSSCSRCGPRRSRRRRAPPTSASTSSTSASSSSSPRCCSPACSSASASSSGCARSACSKRSACRRPASAACSCARARCWPRSARSLGVAGAIGYAALIMLGLRTWWVGAVGTTALRLQPSPLMLAVGAVAGFAHGDRRARADAAPGRTRAGAARC